MDQQRQTEEVMKRFIAAFTDKNPDALKEIVASNCVMESMQPAPNGTRIEGYEANLKFWKAMIEDQVNTFEGEEMIIRGDTAINLWRYRFGEGEKESVRGVTIFRIENGKITEALGYAKRDPITDLGQH